jgi:hypothetical protein
MLKLLGYISTGVVGLVAGFVTLFYVLYVKGYILNKEHAIHSWEWGRTVMTPEEDEFELDHTIDAVCPACGHEYDIPIYTKAIRTAQPARGGSHGREDECMWEVLAWFTVRRQLQWDRC